MAKLKKNNIYDIRLVGFEMFNWQHLDITAFNFTIVLLNEVHILFLVIVTFALIVFVTGEKRL